MGDPLDRPRSASGARPASTRLLGWRSLQATASAQQRGLAAVAMGPCSGTRPAWPPPVALACEERRAAASPSRAGEPAASRSVGRAWGRTSGRAARAGRARAGSRTVGPSSARATGRAGLDVSVFVCGGISRGTSTALPTLGLLWRVASGGVQTAPHSLVEAGGT